MEKEIYREQIECLKTIEKYHKFCNKKEININVSPYNDFVTWTNCLGLQNLKKLEKKNFKFFEFFKTFINEIINIGKNYDYNTAGQKITSNKKINLIYSYCSKDDFIDDAYYDKYFNQNSNQSVNTYWLLLSLDNYIPTKISKNIFIIYNRKKKFNLIYIISYFFNRH